MTFRSVDSKREEFRKYLEKTGVMDALTKALVSLYEEESKPDDALGFLRKHLCDVAVDSAELEELKAKLEASEARGKEMEAKMAQMRDKLGEAEPAKDDEAEHEGDAEHPGEPEAPPADEATDAPEDDAPPPDAAPENGD